MISFRAIGFRSRSRIRMLREILNKIRPEPIREPLPPRRYYEPPKAVMRRRKRDGTLMNLLG